MVNVGIFYGHLEYFMAIWYNLWPVGIVCGHLLFFPNLECLGKENSGNPVPEFGFSQQNENFFTAKPGLPDSTYIFTSKILEGLAMEDADMDYFMAIFSICLPFGLFYDLYVFLWPFGIFPRFGMFWYQEKSGNPVQNSRK
jgi:hypothetical protein